MWYVMSLHVRSYKTSRVQITEASATADIASYVSSYTCMISRVGCPHVVYMASAYK